MKYEYKDRLKNAAPDLLAALVKAKKEIIELTQSDKPGNDEYYPHYIDAAIFKATGKKEKTA